VLDVPPKLGARVRLLAAGDTNKNDPNDARSVAVAALRSAGVREVRADDHAAVLKVWSKRYRDLGRTRTQVVCRLHAVLCDLVPGGVSRPIYAACAARILQQITPPDAVAAARCELAAAFLEDLRRIDAQIRETRRVCQIFCARSFPLSGTGYLSGTLCSRYLMPSFPVYPASARKRPYRGAPGLMLRVPVIPASCAFTGACSLILPGPHDGRSRL
jgi:hypothetical protein